MASYVDGTRARATAARAILAGLKEARSKALRELAALERQQGSAAESVRGVLDKVEDDLLGIPEDASPDEEARLLSKSHAVSEALGELDESSSLVGDFAYELDFTEALKSIEEHIKHALHATDKAKRFAAKAGIAL